MSKRLSIMFVLFSLVGMILVSGCSKEKVYTVTFDANGGSGVMKEQSFVKAVSQALISNAFTREGYKFIAWNTISDGTGVSYLNAQEISLTDDITLYAQWELSTSALNFNGHAYVDLGLPSGTLWATCNVGANTPEEYGDYFAWGETTPKETYNWSTYRYCNGSSTTLTKYCSNADYGNNGFTDALTTLEASDDAAVANWGGSWRMPTYYEMSELNANCTVTWTTRNGVNGRLFTGPNGNSIFLPAAGYRYGSELDNAGAYGGYWSSSLGTDYPRSAWNLNFGSGVYYMGSGYRLYGRSVRPVCVSQN